MRPALYINICTFVLLHIKRWVLFAYFVSHTIPGLHVNIYMYMHINIYEVIWKLDKLINTNNKQLCETTLGIGMFFNEVHSCTYICKYISVDLETSRLLKIEHFPIVTLRLTNVLEWKFKNSVCTTTTDTYILFADIPQRIEIRI